MRILHVGWGYPPEWLGCGPVIYVHSLARAQQEAGHDPLVVCASDRHADGLPPYDPEVVAVDGIPYIHLRNRPVHMHDAFDPGREASDPRLVAAFRHVLRESGPDVVHVHNLVGLSFDVVGVAQEFGARVVFSLHNYFPLCSRDDLFFADAERCAGPTTRSCSSCLGTAIGDDVYRRRHRAAIDMLNRCDTVLAVSSRVAEIFTGQGVDPGIVHVDRIGSVTAEQLWAQLGRRRIATAQPSDGPVRLVFFGSLTARKGIMAFLAAVRLLGHPERVEVHVLGGLTQEMADKVNRLLATFEPAHAARLHFHGGFTQAELPTLLADKDVAVLPPRWDDNGPQTVVEALAAGLPVVGTDVGGLPDVVRHGGNGLLVPDGDPGHLAAAIDRVSGEPGLIDTLRAGIEPPLTMDAHRRALDGYYTGAPTTPAVDPAAVLQPQ